jgi:alpha-1,3-glucosyltransferase
MFHHDKFLGLDFFGLTKLGGCVILVFATSLGPFLNHLPQILSRLFPVQRGLCHAYWAPNFWTLYNLLDISVSKVLQMLRIIPKAGVHPLMTGLVQQADFSLLPNVSPVHCVTITLAAWTPMLVKLFKHPTPQQFLKSVSTAAFTSYFFGYHVHEKAILVILVPYGLLAFSDGQSAKDYFFLSFLGTYSLFPLLFEAQELLVKIVILLMVHILMLSTLRKVYTELKLNRFEKVYIYGLVGHFLTAEVLLPIFLARLEFLPLLLYSAYCSVGIVYCYAKLFISV